MTVRPNSAAAKAVAAWRAGPRVAAQGCQTCKCGPAVHFAIAEYVKDAAAGTAGSLVRFHTQVLKQVGYKYSVGSFRKHLIEHCGYQPPRGGA